MKKLGEEITIAFIFDYIPKSERLPPPADRDHFLSFPFLIRRRPYVKTALGGTKKLSKYRKYTSFCR